MIIQDGESKLMQEGTLYTEADFGCNYFRENSGVLIDMSAIVKKDLELKKQAEKLFIATFPEGDGIIQCKSCGADNCYNNKTCIKCNCQL